MSAGEEYQVEGKGIWWRWGRILCGKKGSKIIFPIKLRLLGRISSGEDGKGTAILGKKIKIFEKLGWGRISSGMELNTPLLVWYTLWFRWWCWTRPTTSRTARGTRSAEPSPSRISGSRSRSANGWRVTVLSQRLLSFISLEITRSNIIHFVSKTAMLN